MRVHVTHDRPDQAERYLRQKDIHAQWESDYLNPDMNRFYDIAFDAILRRLQPKPSDKLLDAGCGYGYHTVRLARGGSHITAVDFSETALAAARRTITDAGLDKQITLQKADLTRLAFQDLSFDFVISWGVVMHIPEMERAIAELARVLKSGGTLVLCENNMHSLDVVIRERAIKAVKKLFGRALPESQRTPRGIEVWKQSETGGLMVRRTDFEFLKNFLATQGLKEAGREAAQFTEAYTNMRLRILKRMVYALNIFYLKFIRIPNLAMGNILYFRKQCIEFDRSS